MTTETPLDWLLERAARLDVQPCETEIEIRPNVFQSVEDKLRERIESCKRTDLELIEYRLNLRRTL